MRIFKSIYFHKFTQKERITDEQLIKAAFSVLHNSSNANLGGGVFKQRIARINQGKSKGYRSILFYKTNEFCLFVYGFSKSVQANISAEELKNFKLAAKEILGLTQGQLDLLVADGKFIEITEHKEQQ